MRGPPVAAVHDDLSERPRNRLDVDPSLED